MGKLFFILLLYFGCNFEPKQNNKVYFLYKPQSTALEINGEVICDSLPSTPTIYLSSDSTEIKIKWKKDSTQYFGVDSVFKQRIFFLEDRHYLQFYDKDIISVKWTEDEHSDTIIYFSNYKKN